ncbi:MAG: hypothetical protein JXA49_09090 [Actinobacteria bacterium]|nr:hypothetical protein [Actinomycetota bacterium]
MKDKLLRRLSGVTLSFLLITVVLSGLSLSGCGGKVIITYDKSPENPVVEYRTGGGLAPLTEDQIADFMLFGDGRVVKDSEESRTGLMVEGKLDEEGVKELLEEIEEAGFFNLEDEYFNKDVMDAPGSRMSVNLNGRKKAVYVYAMDVKGFDEAVGAVMGFPVEDEKEYIPVSGFLYINSVDPGEIEDGGYPGPAGSLPAPEEMARAAETGEPVEVDGGTFAELKSYESEKGKYGIGVTVDGSAYRVFPVYEPSERLR